MCFMLRKCGHRKFYIVKRNERNEQVIRDGEPYTFNSGRSEKGNGSVQDDQLERGRTESDTGSGRVDEAVPGIHKRQHDDRERRIEVGQKSEQGCCRPASGAYVVDANILFSALIKDGLTARLLSLPDISLSAPDFVFNEIMQHGKEILDKTKRSSDDLRKFFVIVLHKVTFYPYQKYYPWMMDAQSLTDDADDFPYVALALSLGLPIWSNDSLFQKQDKIRVFTTTALMNLLKNTPQ